MQRITSAPQGAPSQVSTPQPSRRQQQERPGIGEAAGDLVVDVAKDAAGKLVQDQIKKVVFEQAAAGVPEEAAAQTAVKAAQESGVSISDVTTAIAWARQAYKAYQILSSNMTDEEKAQALTKAAGLAVADYFTGGLASLVYGTLGQSKEWQKVERELEDYDRFMQASGSLGSIWGGSTDAGDFANVLTGGRSGVFANIGKQALGISHPLHRKSTKQYQAERTQDLLGMSDDFHVQRSIAQLRNPEAAGVKRDEGRVDLENATPEQFWGSEGVLKTFGPEYWLKDLNELQRREITQALIDARLFRTDKGDVVIPDEFQERAREIANETLAGISDQAIADFNAQLQADIASGARPSAFTGEFSDEALRAKASEQAPSPGGPRITSAPQGPWGGSPQSQQVKPQPQGPRITSAPQGAWAGASIQGGV